MCLMCKAKKGDILKLCQKSPSRHFIGYKIIYYYPNGAIYSPIMQTPINIGKNTDKISRGYSRSIESYGRKTLSSPMCLQFSYPKGFHIYATKTSAEQVLEVIEQDLKKREENSVSFVSRKFTIIPVYFYKKHIKAEGYEDYEGENRQTQSVIVVKEYTTRQKDVSVAINKTSRKK